MYGLSKLRTELERSKGRQSQIQDTLAMLEKKIKTQTTRLETAQQAQLIFQIVAQETQKQLEYHLNELVSLALKAVFGKDAYELKMQFRINRGKTEAQPLFIREGKKRLPMKSTGFGPVDIAAFFLRPTLWSLEKPQRRGLFIYDEPLRHLNDPQNIYHTKAAGMIRELSTRIGQGLQIIIITQKHELIDVGDKVFAIGQRDRRSYVKGE
jgi:chromosome segregation ATPase